MVHSGRLSEACFPCRGRRIKCDKTRPGCSQCKRMNITCSGYRELWDQKFRDMNESVAKAAQKSYKNSVSRTARPRKALPKPDEIDHLSSLTPLGSTTTSGSSYDTDQSMIWPTITHSVKDIAIVHFMTSYIPGSHFDYLPTIHCQVDSSSTLLATVQAAATAALGQEMRQPHLMQQARRLYVRALLETNTALANPSTATEDATLISVLLLGLFETIAWIGPRTPDSWIIHTRGALVLLKLRGSQQFKTRIGRQLFVQVTRIACVNSLQQKSRLPAELKDLMKEAALHESEYSKYQFAHLTGEVADLVADINEKKCNAGVIVEAAKVLDSKYILLGKRLPPYQEIETATSQSGVCSKTFHRYSDHRAAQLWNSYRMTRILLNEIVYAFPSSTNSKNSAIQTEAIQHVQQMAADICASLSQFTIANGSVTLGAPTHLAWTMVFPSTISKASAASLLWPLSVVRGASKVSEEVKQFAEEQLKILASGCRMPQAERIGALKYDDDSLENG
ncbi:hypothetical protein P153DRAFT_313739 [Dothidotthia symphoricarpi CBS 119687]|uniref:Zn(2)-C6 fungal-type domain-containing protein n=1 Tax=Dothidotthia symphoricarpi CBS 119687 TaxID=1392245 RepID=A0A6A6AEE3_9PLEO|nr:uncharacterized protein P153DRAFT_313739 [Dothidotthia symphoricarpi CBS 119687]KAF2130180.1 hypothetical protein P153DRAFT_313739 [Dothidotthia symphoricarpi CBS 119687]